MFRIMRLKLLVILCTVVGVLTSQPECFGASYNNKLKGYATAYGFLLGQDATLARIPEKFPMLANSALVERMRFDAAFPNAKNKLEARLKNGLGAEKMDVVKARMLEQVKSFAGAVATQEQAESFLAEMPLRAKGDIVSPALEYLLAAEYAAAPVNEFLDGYRTKFSTRGHKKSLGLEMILYLPKSWEAEETDWPAAVQKWSSRNEQVTELITLGIEDSDLSAKEFKYLIKTGGYKKLAAGGKIVKSGAFTVAGQPGGWIEFTQKTERLGAEYYQHLLLNVFYYRGKEVCISCGSTGPLSDRKITEASYALMQPLCRQVLNSIILVD
jgi:hypothetical protein